MKDNGDEQEGDGVTDEEKVASEADTEDDAILHKKNEPSSLRENF
ncbi:hypothetical protein [uncultured Desulfosarcina sp.]|nr:hypothetical protein [uncultured Desulfosarcina sp.]